MPDIESKYIQPINWIKRKRSKKTSWEDIESFGIDDSFFENMINYDDWPSDTQDMWPELLKNIKEIEKKRKEISDIVNRGRLHGPGQTNTLTVPEEEDSCWKLYRNRLESNGFTNIDMIEEECINILNSLNSDTANTPPIKGLVVGYVQSGKTANMSGLISMAADHGWNLFIILSGTIDSLRIQTRDRLYDDVSNDRCKYVWQKFDHLAPNLVDANPSNLDLKSTSPAKYLTVCLKNKKRLTDLLKWLNMDSKKKRQMKILLIDDEADQASINTQKPDAKRKGINDLIVKIVECRDTSNKDAEKYGAMNYISYTATPYANFLSEGVPESLYPRHFVQMLTPPSLYMGTKRLYGNDIESFSDISPFIDYSIDTDNEMGEYIFKDNAVLPPGLKKAIAWFVCASSVFRYWNYKKPASMLVHTSAYTADHSKVARGIYDYITMHKNELLQLTESVYAEQTKRLPPDLFNALYTDYERSDEIKPYPDYSEIKELIIKLLNQSVQHIKIDAEDNIIYDKGIHLCIDNSKNDIIDNDEEEEKCLPRIIYPKKELNYSPAFIVVGGNTLSRGLTIEGLVSTYFTRNVKQGDTLMQMGRWFGYRIGYELLPRIWMSEESAKSFVFLSDVDESLREFIRDNYGFLTPEQLPPRVKKFPKNCNLKSITANNKQRAAVTVDSDFEGCSTELTSFDKDPQEITYNLNLTKEYLLSLGSPSIGVSGQKVWRGVKGERLFNDFMSKFKFSKRQRNFYKLDDMKIWLEKNSDFYNWSVILANSEKTECDETWQISDDLQVGKVIRSSKCNDPNLAVIGALSSPIDKIADADIYSKYSKDEIRDLKKNISSKYREVREKCDLRNTPALIIYCISKNSAPKSPKFLRYPLNVSDDLIGLCIVLPGIKNNNKSGYIQIPTPIINEVQ